MASTRRRLASQLTIGHERTQDPEIVVSEDERWELLSRCLHDPQLPTDVRAAGALILLYGLQVTRIIELTQGHLRRPHGPAGPTSHQELIDPGQATIANTAAAAVPDGLRITLSGPLITVPPALGQILARLPAKDVDPRSVPLIERQGLQHREPGNEQEWLFPGRAARGHVNASVLSSRLRHHGIQARQSRNAALIALASDLPMSVISVLFTISISTATHWARRAGRDWHAYIAAVRHHQTNQ